MNRWTIAAFLLLEALPASAQGSKAEADRAALLKTDTEWARHAAMGKDVERIISFWTDDAVIYPPREPPIVGKAAIRKYVTGSLQTPWFSIKWKPAQAVVAASADIGYTTGTNEITFPDANGKVVTSNGRYLAVWRRTGNGPWRCVVDFWNEAPVPPRPRRPARPPRK